MRIFISMPDETGSHKTTRLSIINCTDTSELIRIISKQLNINKNAFIFLLKNEIVNLRILENWPLSLYGVKNGSWIILNQNLLFYQKQLSNSSTASLQRIQQSAEQINSEVQISFLSSSPKVSFFTHKSEQDFHEYFQKQLTKMLMFVRQNKLQQIAMLLKQEPEIQDEKLREQILNKKNSYILNEIGQCGRNSLHWAIHNQSFQVVTFLLMKFTNPTTLTIDEYTPLQLAVVHRNILIVRILLGQPKVDPNKITTHGTALHLAAYHHSVDLVKQLLDNGANPDQLDKDGKRPIQLSEIKQIKRIFQDHDKKLKLRLIKPNITKGTILKVSALTFRGKQKVLMINPFKGDFILLKENNVVDHKIRLSNILSVEKIAERTWLMDNKIDYFKITYGVQNAEEKIIIGIKHVQILGKWLSAIEIARTYAKNQKYVTKIEPQMQLIEVLDDSKNQIKVHKRQVQNKKTETPNRNKYSIINMKVSPEIKQTKEKKEKTQKIEPFSEVHFEQEQLQKSFASSTEGNQFRESEILLGSILMEKNYDDRPSPSNRNTVSTISFGKNTTYMEEQFLSHPAKLSNFRKKSSDLTRISQFKVEEKKKVTFSDFQFKKLLGSGAFGQVYLTKHKKTQKLYAMKVLNKKKLMAKKQLKYAVSETNILKRVSHDFIIGLHFSFQTPSNLYLALDYCPYGDLSQILCEKQRFTEMTARFIIAQVILSIEYIHTLKIIYRDLKPDNILISKDGYVKLIDFGLSKQNHFATSFCGSPAYLSPQMLQKKGHGFPTDIYGLGCVLYEMVIGQPPYFDQNMEKMFDNIKNARLKFPGFLTKQIRSLLGRMLERDVSKRIGASSMKQLKSHEFFSGFSWQKLSKKQLTVPNQIFPESIQSEYFHLQNKMNEQNIKYVDQDYTEASMLNRIKGFSFCRDQNG